MNCKKKYLLVILAATTLPMHGMECDLPSYQEPTKEEVTQQEKQAYENLLKLVQERIDCKQDMNDAISAGYFKMRPLIQACNKGDKYLYITQLLLVNGADANILDHNRETPLHYAADQLAIETVKLLLEAKPKPANPNTMSNLFGTPLHNICNSFCDEINNAKCAINRVKIAKLLLRSDANPNAQDISKRNCLYYLIIRSYKNFLFSDPLIDKTSEQRDLFFKQRRALIRTILEYGGSLALTDEAGKTPIQRAHERCKDDPLNKETYGQLAQYACKYCEYLRKNLLFCLRHPDSAFKDLPTDVVNLIIDNAYPKPPEPIAEDQKNTKL